MKLKSYQPTEELPFSMILESRMLESRSLCQVLVLSRSKFSLAQHLTTFEQEKLDETANFYNSSFSTFAFIILAKKWSIIERLKHAFFTFFFCIRLFCCWLGGWTSATSHCAGNSAKGETNHHLQGTISRQETQNMWVSWATVIIQ